MIASYFQLLGLFSVIIIVAVIGMLSISIFLIKRDKIVGVYVPISYVVSLSPFLLLILFVLLPYCLRLISGAQPCSKIRLSNIDSETFLTKLEYPNNDVSICIEGSNSNKKKIIWKINAGESNIVFRIVEKRNMINLYYTCDKINDGCDTTEHQIDSLCIKIQPIDIISWNSIGVPELYERGVLGKRIRIH